MEPIDQRSISPVLISLRHMISLIVTQLQKIIIFVSDEKLLTGPKGWNIANWHWLNWWFLGTGQAILTANYPKWYREYSMWTALIFLLFVLFCFTWLEYSYHSFCFLLYTKRVVFMVVAIRRVLALVSYTICSDTATDLGHLYQLGLASNYLLCLG